MLKRTLEGKFYHTFAIDFFYKIYQEYSPKITLNNLNNKQTYDVNAGLKTLCYLEIKLSK